MIDWWSETDHAILRCLGTGGPMSPEELSRRVGLSAGELAVFLAMLVREGRIRIRSVDLGEEEVHRRERTRTSVSWRDDATAEGGL
jgi:DNA-binding Lrp family transcriptional regulator